MIDDSVLVDEWHVVARSDDVPEEGVAAARLLGEDLVVWRQQGEVMVSASRREVVFPALVRCARGPLGPRPRLPPPLTCT